VVRKGVIYSGLEDVTFQSGLGDSAYLLYGLVRSLKPNVVVEIGSARGRSTCFIGTGLKENGTGKLYAIDPHTSTAWNDIDSVDTYDLLKSNLQKLKLQDHVDILRQTSDVAASGWNKPIDLLFIDGDHSYDGAMRDWELFSPFVQPFGSVIFHDTLWDLKPDPKYARADMGVPRVVEELREAGYPVLTIDRDFGVSLIQPVKNGVPLRAPNATSNLNGGKSKSQF
jgi:predicted O-methyltransferase YrrM